MSFVVTSSSVVSTTYNNLRGGSSRVKCCESASKVSYFLYIHCKYSSCITENIRTTLRRKPNGVSMSTVTNCTKPDFQSLTDEDAVFIDLGDQGNEDGENIDSPWEGAVVYKRKASVTHVVYCTTLERLGLGNLSTEVSKSRASEMGLRVTKAVKYYPNGTPVQISVDITRRKQKLRLEGIMKTVITLTCSRCGDPAAESIFSNFTLLLTDEPVEEPDIINMGVLYGDNAKTLTGFGADENDDDSIDFENQLYFPHEDSEIDISKHIRDSAHLEITISATCDPNCKGLRLNCGKNLNSSNCICSIPKAKETTFGPLGNLKKQK